MGNDLENATLLKKVLAAQEEIERPRQVHEVVPVRKWLDSDYYLGPTAFELYDYWRHEITDFFENGPNGRHFSEWVIGGSIGTGKSTAGVVTLARLVYELSCFRPIPRLFGLMEASKIAMIYFSISKDQALKTGFGQLVDIINGAGYFRDCFRPKDKQSELEWEGKNLICYPGSSAEHSKGGNMLAALMDEANFLKKSGGSAMGDMSKAMALYEEITTRRLSRFLRDGVDHGISILISSATHQSSFTQKRVEQAGPRTKVTETVIWEVKPWMLRKSYDIFFVYTGNEMFDPRIVDSAEDIEQILKHYNIDVGDDFLLKDQADALNAAMPGSIISVPWMEDFREAFERNCVHALSELAGVAVAPSGRLFSHKKKFHECCHASLKHPFSRREIIVSTGESFGPEKYLLKYNLITGHRPRIHAESPRFIHIDQSYRTDSTGLAMVHATPSGYGGLAVYIDFMLRINPPDYPHEIDINSITRFVVDLKLEYDIPVKRVTYDGYQSRPQIQHLREKGIEADMLSVDRDDQAYMTMIGLIHSGNMFYYPYPPFEEELFSLEHDRKKGKVDHPAKGSKDVTDAVAGAVYGAVMHSSARQAMTDRDWDNLEKELDPVNMGVPYELLDDYQEIDLGGFGA